VLQDEPYEQVRERLEKSTGLKADEMIVMEGCPEDTKVILGGKKQFLSHFCDLFDFNICHSYMEHGAIKKTARVWSDEDEVNRQIEQFVAKFDKME
jgi:hypothetical protein